jgi:hypothetical protein
MQRRCPENQLAITMKLALALSYRVGAGAFWIYPFSEKSIFYPFALRRPLSILAFTPTHSIGLTSRPLNQNLLDRSPETRLQRRFFGTGHSRSSSRDADFVPPVLLADTGNWFASTGRLAFEGDSITDTGLKLGWFAKVREQQACL